LSLPIKQHKICTVPEDHTAHLWQAALITKTSEKERFVISYYAGHLETALATLTHALPQHTFNKMWLGGSTQRFRLSVIGPDSESYVDFYCLGGREETQPEDGAAKGKAVAVVVRTTATPQAATPQPEGGAAKGKAVATVARTAATPKTATPLTATARKKKAASPSDEESPSEDDTESDDDASVNELLDEVTITNETGAGGGGGSGGVSGKGPKKSRGGEGGGGGGSAGPSTRGGSGGRGGGDGVKPPSKGGGGGQGKKRKKRR
jgi:uncharacterized membrane protein YgcG